MAKTLTYGMVGGGPDAFIGDAHRRAIGLDGTAVIAAGVFSRNLEKSLQTAEELGISTDRCYEDYRAMARAEGEREDGIDFVVVVTPNQSHYEICRAFLEAGIHVVCDKPGTTTYRQAKELEALAEDRGLLFMVTYTYMGYYANLGKFRSDDEKTGDILAYVGSRAGAGYFPKEVTLNQNEIYRIESSVLPYPCFRDGDLCAMVQGAGFSIAQSDSTHEYASAVFLKWLTQEEQNLDFAVNSGYLPVENSSLNQGYAKAMAAAEATLKMLSEYRFYSNPPFEGSYEMRQFYGEYMEASVDNARLEAEDKMKAGMTKEEAQAQVTDEAHFQEWYEGWQDNAAKLLGS